MENPFEKMRMAADGNQEVIKEAEEEERRQAELEAVIPKRKNLKKVAKLNLGQTRKDWLKEWENKKEKKEENRGEVRGPDAIDEK